VITTLHCHLVEGFEIGIVDERWPNFHRRAQHGAAASTIQPDLYDFMLSLSLLVCKLPITTHAVVVISAASCCKLQKARDAISSDRSPGMSRSKSHGNFTDSPSRLAELEPEAPAKSFSSHGSSVPDNAAQDQVSHHPCTESVTCPVPPMPVSDYIHQDQATCNAYAP